MINKFFFAGQGAPASSDPQFNDVVLLMHMDGIDGATTFIDSSNDNHTVTAIGTAQIDTDIAVFSGSALFDGNSDYLSIPDSASFDFLSGAGAIEARVYIAAASELDNIGARHATIVSNFSILDSSYWGFQISGDATDTGLSLVLQTDQGNRASGLLSPQLSYATWYALAVSWDATGVYFFVDGVLVGTNTAFSSNLIGGTQPRVGCLDVATFERRLNGNIDELRITNGSLRHTASYTVATSPFPDN